MVCIIGVIILVAVPNFMNSRERAHLNICRAQQKNIDDMKAMWAIVEVQPRSSLPAWDDLIPDYLKKIPVCPDAGTYTIGDIDTNATCDVVGH